MHDMAGVCDVSQAQVMHASDVTGGPHHLVPCHPTREHRRESVCTVQPGPHFTISATHDPFLELGAAQLLLARCVPWSVHVLTELTEYYTLHE